MDKKIETEQIVSYEENVVKVNQKTNEEKNVKENKIFKSRFAIVPGQGFEPR